MKTVPVTLSVSRDMKTQKEEVENYKSRHTAPSALAKPLTLTVLFSSLKVLSSNN